MCVTTDNRQILLLLIESLGQQRLKPKYYGQVHAGETDDEEVHGGCEEVPQVTQGQGPQERGASYHHGQQGDKGV